MISISLPSLSSIWLWVCLLDQTKSKYFLIFINSVSFLCSLYIEWRIPSPLVIIKHRDDFGQVTEFLCILAIRVLRVVVGIKWDTILEFSFLKLRSPIGPFTILKPHNQDIGNFYVVQERCMTDFKAQKVVKGSVGSVCTQRFTIVPDLSFQSFGASRPTPFTI